MSSPQPSQDLVGIESNERDGECISSQIEDRDVVNKVVTTDTKKDGPSKQRKKKQKKPRFRQSNYSQMPYAMSEFEYKPLERLANRPSIRLVILHPGNREDSIRLELRHTAFAAKPRYEALSYTWGDKNLVDVQIDGQNSSIRRNLHQALTHLRDETDMRTLWIDAICINQTDDAEKSWQVQLMGDIYRRARRVLIWLGVISESLDNTWLYTKTKERNHSEYTELCQQPYWTRIWIVQEVCAAADMDIHWDISSKNPNTWIAKSESWDRFFRNITRFSKLDVNLNPAIGLARVREGRYKDDFLLPNLIKSCSHCLCELPHDKIYGFVGIAHDCEDLSFPINYAKPLWELHEDTIRFFYNSVHIEGSKSIVRLSQLVLRLLGEIEGAPTSNFMHSECSTPCNGHLENGSCLFRVSGVNGGEVSILGPTYEELVGNPSSATTWNLALRRCTTDKSLLRAESEKFITDILALEDSEISGTSALDSFGWRSNGEYETPYLLRLCVSSDMLVTPSLNEQHWCSSDYHLFATSNGTIGLVHAKVEKGDKIFHFWESDAVAVMREEEDGTLRIIGKALLAEQWHTSQLPHEGTLDFNVTTDLYLDIVALRNLTL